MEALSMKIYHLIMRVFFISLFLLSACSNKTDPVKALEKHLLEDSALKQTAWDYYTVTKTNSALTGYIIFPPKRSGITRRAPVDSEFRRLCPDKNIHTFWQSTELDSFELILMKNVDRKKGKAKRLLQISCTENFSLAEHEEKLNEESRKSREKEEFIAKQVPLTDPQGWLIDVKEAIRTKKIEVVKTMLGEYPQHVDMRDNDGNTFLHRSSTVKIVKLLIEIGADVNAKNKRQETPLQHAARLRNNNVALLLIENGAKLNSKSQFGLTPLNSAGSVEMARFLVKHGARVTDGELLNPAFYAKQELAEYFISIGAKLEHKDTNGQTALHKAVQSFTTTDRSVAMAEWLLENGANVNARDNFGSTPFDVAKRKNSSEKKMLELIKRYGGVPGRQAK